MSIIRLRFRDINDQVLGDLEISKDVPIKELLPLILEQLNLAGSGNWQLVMDRVVDTQHSFTEAGARDGSVVQLVSVEAPAISLTREVQLTISSLDPQQEQAGQANHLQVRKQEIAAISRGLEQQRHVLIVGAPGIGKSHLIHYTRDHLVASGAGLYVDSFEPVETALQQIALILYQRRQLIGVRSQRDIKTMEQELSRQQPERLTTLVGDSLRGHNYVLMIDNLDTITLAGIAALQQLMRVTTVVAAARAESLDKLGAVLDRFDRVQLEPLPDDAIRAILWSLLDYDSIAKPRVFETKALEAAGGRPGVVVEMVAGYRRGQYFSPVWIALATAVLALAFYLASRALGAPVAYLIAAVLAIALLVARALLWKKMVRETS